MSLPILPTDTEQDVEIKRNFNALTASAKYFIEKGVAVFLKTTRAGLTINLRKMPRTWKAKTV